MHTYSKNRFRFFAVAIGLGLTVACGPLRKGEAAGSLAPAHVYFANESLDQAAVYAVSGSQEIRIGTVMPGRTDTLSVPVSMLGAGSLRIVARPLARSIAASSGLISLSAGEELSVRLPADQRTLFVLPPRS